MSSDKIQLDVAKREVTGKAVAKLREGGDLPAVIYGKDYAPINVQAPQLAVERAVREAGTHTPVVLKLDGKEQTAIIKTIDIDPVHNRLQHVAFQAVSADQIVTTEVPIIVVALDESEAGKAGLEVMQSIEHIEIKAKPADLPEKLEVSAAGTKEHGDKLTVADIVLPSGVELADEADRELTIATIVDPAIEAAKAEAAEKAAAEAEAAAAPAEGEVSAEGAETAEGEATADEAKSE
ncbi:50S ribosomal protein L25 [Alphaproteobacteria bacterium]|nr:50S ribosomal protein L25 [Alphaproteobacteria bacterium]